jgi:hypothetical protein
VIQDVKVCDVSFVLIFMWIHITQIAVIGLMFCTVVSWFHFCFSLNYQVQLMILIFSCMWSYFFDPASGSRHIKA